MHGHSLFDRVVGCWGTTALRQSTTAQWERQKWVVAYYDGRCDARLMVELWEPRGGKRQSKVELELADFIQDIVMIG